MKKSIKDNSDVIVYNGFIIKENCKIYKNDKIVFIKKGEMPKYEDMEAMLMAKYIPFVHAK